MTLILILVVLLILLAILVVSRFKRCPDDKILVIFGITNDGKLECLASGSKFVWPIIQDYGYLDTAHMAINVDPRKVKSSQKGILLNISAEFKVAISTQEDDMVNAAEHFLGKSKNDIGNVAKHIIYEQVALIVASMDIETINSDINHFITKLATDIGADFKKIGLQIINIDISDIQVDSETGFIRNFQS